MSFFKRRPKDGGTTTELDGKNGNATILTEEQQMEMAIQESIKAQKEQEKSKINPKKLAKDLDLFDLTEDERLQLAMEMSKEEETNKGKKMDGSGEEESDEDLKKALLLSRLEDEINKTGNSDAGNVLTIGPEENVLTIGDDDFDQDCYMVEPTTSENHGEFESDEELQKVLKLSLDPQEQNNREHREFLEFLNKKNLEREGNVLTIGDDKENEGATSNNGMNEYVMNGLSEEEQLAIAMLRSSSSDSSTETTSSESYLSKVQNGYAKVKSLPKRNLPPKDQFSSSPYTVPNNAISRKTPGSLRPIIVDGCNVAWAHGNHEKYSAKGLEILYARFLRMGHRDITIFVRSYDHLPEREQAILNNLKSMEVLTVCPESRRYGDKYISHYDDLMLVEYACRCKGIIVSCDKYRDIIGHSREFKEQITNRVLPYAWVKDELLLTQDPLGKNGPNLKEFLRY